jgi:hypothetical protein
LVAYWVVKMVDQSAEKMVVLKAVMWVDHSAGW